VKHGKKIQRKIRAYEPLDIDAMRTLAVSVFHKDKLTREELRQWLDAEFSAISDAALRGEAVMRDEERNNSLLRKMRMHIAEWEAVGPLRKEISTFSLACNLHRCTGSYGFSVPPVIVCTVFPDCLVFSESRYLSELSRVTTKAGRRYSTGYFLIMNP
jgi:hypothetical protein